jgi:DNA-directed RNA polymerase subunit RPC12/RpoP
MRARFGRDIYCQQCGKDDRITIMSVALNPVIRHRFSYQYVCQRCNLKVAEKGDTHPKSSDSEIHHRIRNLRGAE